ncbi:MAG TPA: histidine kinase [Chitinophagaceae bacterium]|nr:histidine kinase [Chitinophagaceae bacterium]
MKGVYRQLYHPLWRILQHLSFWVLSFFVFLHLFRTGPYPEKIDYIYTLLFHASIMPAVYLNLELLLPKLGNYRRGWLYILLVLVLIAGFAWINYSFFEQWSSSLLPDYFFISYFRWQEVVLIFAVYIIITTLLKLSRSWFRVNELQRELLEKEQLRSQVELKALKAQINPHFFFNTLNSIYSMAIDHDERLPGTVLHLSDLMRYVLYETKERFIPLEKELAVLRDYISLQKLRSNQQLQVELVQEGQADGQEVAPLLLINFLENAFKHGAKGSSGKAFIRILIQIREKRLIFEVENSKGKIDPSTAAGYKGMGLENAGRQLELLYPGKHELAVKDTANTYLVKLQLEL